MKIKQLIVLSLLSAIVGCTSSASPAATEIKPTHTRLPASVLTPTLTPIPTSTLFPFPALTPSLTPIASITPLSGFDIWDQMSKPGIYTIQYLRDDWIEGEWRLTHARLDRCFLAEHGGTDMCMAGGCPTPHTITLGDVVFSKMASGNSSAIYSSASYFGLSFEVHSFNEDSNKDVLCIEAAEKVLGTLQIRPERGCTDQAAFVADVTIPDNTVIQAGTKFTKTWRLRNVGTCTWSQRYILQIYGKSSGIEADWVALHESVEPQQTVDISTELPAPLFEGIARWEGVLKNEFGDSFGLGSEPYTDMFGKPFWVQIIVAPATSP